MHKNTIHGWKHNFGSGRTPILLGKPSKKLAEEIVEELHLDPKRMCMVGDRLNTDMLFGKSVGMQTLLVLSGVTTGNEAWSLNDENPCKPDYISSSIASLIIKNEESDHGYEGDFSSKESDVGDFTDGGTSSSSFGTSSGGSNGRHHKRRRKGNK